MYSLFLSADISCCLKAKAFPMLRLITDFDGPVMDISERYYRVYEFCLAQTQYPGQPLNILSKSEFWEMKRSCMPEAEIGRISGLTSEQAEQFAQWRRQTAHALSNLVYDQPAPHAFNALERVQQAGVDLAVATLRRERELEEAFTRCNLARFFSPERCFCLHNDYVKTGDVNDKPLLLQNALAQLPPASEVWMVGDTEADIIAAKSNQVKAIAVLCGIRNRPQLERYQPDVIVNHLSEAVDVILENREKGRF